MSSDIDQLNQRFAFPGQIHFGRGQGGQTTAYLNDAHGCGEVSLLGGHVLSYRRHEDEKGLFWLSDLAVFEEGKSIRGGVPIILPWFGGHPERPDLPAHGLARTRMWEVLETRELEDGGTELILGFESNEKTREIWPHDFSARLHIRSTEGSFALELEVTNTGNEAFSWGSGFHPYFAVDDIAKVRVSGLDGVEVLDTLTGNKAIHQGEVSFEGEVDSVFLESPENVIIKDGSRNLQITSHGADAIFAWNPGVTAQKADLPEGGYREFVCVENGVAAGAMTVDEMAILEAGEIARFGVEYR